MAIAALPLLLICFVDYETGDSLGCVDTLINDTVIEYRAEHYPLNSQANLPGEGRMIVGWHGPACEFNVEIDAYYHSRSFEGWKGTMYVVVDSDKISSPSFESPETYTGFPHCYGE